MNVLLQRMLDVLRPLLPERRVLSSVSSLSIVMGAFAFGMVLLASPGWAQGNRAQPVGTEVAVRLSTLPPLLPEDDGERRVPIERPAVTLHLEGVTLAQALEHIAAQADMQLIYASYPVLTEKQVTMHLTAVPVRSALEKIIEGTGLEVQHLASGSFVLVRAPEVKKVPPHPVPLDLKRVRLPVKLPVQVDLAHLPPGVIRGRVTDAETGATLPGVNVVIEGTQRGAATGVDGHYQLSNVPPGAHTLIASFVGYKESRREAQVAPGDTAVVNFALEKSAVGLNEVIVVGYGTQVKKALTGSVVTINTEELSEGAAITALDMIQGKVPGLHITRTAGMDPNAKAEIQLRGMSTLRAEADPLIIIDGVPAGNNMLQNIAPASIKSITVLKDASAGAIYGARASNGVILVETKQGRATTPVFNYWSRVTVQHITGKPRVLTADEYRAIAERPDNPYSASMKDYGAKTDWFGRLINDYPISQSHTLSMTGGTENTNYRVSVNYRNMQPVVIETSRKEGHARVNVNHIGLDERLKVNVNLATTFATAHYTNYDAFEQAMKRNPTLPVRNEDGSFKEVEGYDVWNPVALLNQRERGGKWRYLRGSVKGTFAIQDNWDVSARIATTRDDHLNHTYVDRNAWELNRNQENLAVEDNVYRSSASYLERLLEGTTTYLFERGAHRLNTLAGYSYQDFERSWTASSRGKLIAFFGRINYSYDYKYLLSASVRREGSSKLGKNNKWGWFPAVSAGWRLSSEPFMDGLDFVDNLKLRAGFGITGNEGIDPFLSKARMGPGGRWPMWVEEGYYRWAQTYGLAGNPNPDLRWEEKREWNVGLDFGLFNGRLSGSIDLYDRTTTDLLYSYTAQIPPMIHSEVMTNVGTIENRGIEVMLGATPVESSNFTWNTSFTFSHNQNEIVSLSNDVYELTYIEAGWLSSIGGVGNTVRIVEGRPVGSFYGRKFAGFTEDGQWLFYNSEGEAVTDDQISDEDMRFLGNGMPDYFASWTNTFSYKNFSLTVFLRGTFGFQILNAKELYYGNKTFLPSNLLKSAVTKHAELNDKPQFSDYYLEPGDYIKFDTITLSYAVPLRSDLVRKLSVYVTGQNLFTITGYSGLDPELSRSGLAPGIDGLGYFPRSRSFSLGLNFGF